MKNESRKFRKGSLEHEEQDKKYGEKTREGKRKVGKARFKERGEEERMIGGKKCLGQN